MKFLEQSFDRQNQFWKYLVVILVALFGGQILGSIPLIGVMMYKSIASGGSIALNPDNFMDFTVFGISKNWGLFLMMLPFVATLLLAIVLIRVLHKRSFAQTVNGTRKIRINRCLTGVAVWSVLMVIEFLVSYFLNPGDYRLQFNLSAFIPLLLISVFLVSIQSTAEEFLFRGYLTQGVAGWTKSRWLAILIPGLLFGLMHSFNPEIKQFGFLIAIPEYVFWGLLFGLIVVLDDGIELAIGMHVANNVLSSLFITHSFSALQTDAVFVMTNPTISIKDIIGFVIMGMIALAFFTRKYKWNFNILNQKVVNS